MPYKRILTIGLAVGLFGHLAQAAAAYFLWDPLYLATPELARDPGHITVFYYLGLGLVVGVVLSYLIYLLQYVWPQSFIKIGIRAAFLLWAASSPIYILKRQLILDLSLWLILEIVTDLIIYILMGALAGFAYNAVASLSGKEIKDDRYYHAHNPG